MKVLTFLPLLAVSSLATKVFATLIVSFRTYLICNHLFTGQPLRSSTCYLEQGIWGKVTNFSIYQLSEQQSSLRLQHCKALIDDLIVDWPNHCNGINSNENDLQCVDWIMRDFIHDMWVCFCEADMTSTPGFDCAIYDEIPVADVRGNWIFS